MSATPIVTSEFVLTLLVAEKIAENAFITPVLTESEVSVLTEKISEHGKLLSKIPLFE